MSRETRLDFDKKACSPAWARGAYAFDQEERFTLALGEFIILIVSLHQRLLEFFFPSDSLSLVNYLSHRCIILSRSLTF